MDKKIITEECTVCGGSGFSGYGTGYDAVCDNCGGAGELPCYTKSKERLICTTQMSIHEMKLSNVLSIK